mmetsp:Transcript_43899/g.81634  ORF Transcript_43899/g.81634 Transcript_43899/m.81634 type:complete len:653 (-) Transcript_43899:86-2044(-)|eukprot:CAMPEP_0197457212 /NCGR_PEP_ID=MMETSP1175-20131217/45400_1 /TAXON_ID=1003142 /ORGANISM="Triceratium dubium, Strain CCMP147" /LENGTH=652 /DNA_ID=CAMNT_0042991501 /DNA_START=781 /DNA_END=2739 /DNA_ORIENTATION=-
MGAAAEVGSNLLLFALVFGMSATVDIKDLKKQVENRNALLTGVFLQFVVLPFLGFAVVKALNLNAAMGVTLLVVTSSPGGSYSNWWCSMFNADLALSVTMTAISTLLSIVMLPINLTIYTTFSYSGDVVKNLDWISLFVSLVVVIGAIGSGLFCSAKVHSHRFNLLANKLGNVAGVSLVVYSILVSGSDGEDPSGGGEDAQGLWDRDWVFYFGVAAPCVLGLVIANLLTSFLRLAKPERVTASVECCYQNVGIASSVAISMFEGDELSEAIGVPLFYGLVEAVVLGFYCIGAWKMGWTKAPRDEKICVVIMTSYEVEEAMVHDVDAIEVVLGENGEKEGGLPGDLLFNYDAENGYHFEEGTLLMISHPPGAQDDDGMATAGWRGEKDTGQGSREKGTVSADSATELGSATGEEQDIAINVEEEEETTTSSSCHSPMSSADDVDMETGENDDLESPPARLASTMHPDSPTPYERLRDDLFLDLSGSGPDDDSPPSGGEEEEVFRDEEEKVEGPSEVVVVASSDDEFTENDDQLHNERQWNSGSSPLPPGLADTSRPERIRKSASFDDNHARTNLDSALGEPVSFVRSKSHASDPGCAVMPVEEDAFEAECGSKDEITGLIQKTSSFDTLTSIEEGKGKGRKDNEFRIEGESER